MKIRATKPMRSERRAEQSTDRKERQKELRTPTPRKPPTFAEARMLVTR